MPRKPRSRIPRKLTLGLVALVAAVLPLTAATAPAAASARGGAGTLTNPWVPPLNAHTTCATTGIYGNYFHGQHLDKITDLPANTYVLVRYITSDGRSADVLWHDGGTWGFILTSCFAFS